MFVNDLGEFGLEKEVWKGSPKRNHRKYVISES